MIREEALQNEREAEILPIKRQELSNWVRTNGRRLEESEVKRKEPWGEERGGGDCLYSNLTRCHFSLYVYGDTKGEKHTQYRIRHVRAVSRAVPGILTSVST